MKELSSQSWTYGVFYTVSIVFTITAICFAGYSHGSEKANTPVPPYAYPQPTQNQWQQTTAPMQPRPATMPNVVNSAYPTPAPQPQAAPAAPAPVQPTQPAPVKTTPPPAKKAPTQATPKKTTPPKTTSPAKSTSTSKTTTTAPKSASTTTKKSEPTKTTTTNSKPTVMASNTSTTTNSTATKTYTAEAAPVSQTTNVTKPNNTVQMDSYSNGEGTIDVDEGELQPAAPAPQVRPTQVESNMQRQAESSTKASIPNVDSSQLGWNGPLGFSTQYDNELGFIGDLKYNTGILADAFAGALELQGGERIARANATLGYAINPNNHVKLSVERLDEDLDFDFVDGTERHWDGQNAIGGAYEYVIPKGWLNALEVGGYHTHSFSKNLSDAVTVDDLGVPSIASRRIAGANSDNGSVSAAMRLWPMSRLKAGVDYDKVNYDTKYVDDDTVNTKGFGGHANLEQVVSDRTKVVVGGEVRKPFNDFDGEIDYLIPSAPNRRMEVGLTSNYTHSKTTTNDYFTNGVTFRMSMGVPTANPNNGSYKDFAAPQIMDIGTWVGEPAVRMPEVLAIADGTGYSTAPGYGYCPPASSLQWDASTNTYVTQDGQWRSNPVHNSDFPLGPPVENKAGDLFFTKAKIGYYALHPTADGVSCEYEVPHNGSNIIAVTNTPYSGQTMSIVGSNWEDFGGGLSICAQDINPTPSHNPQLCPFKTANAFTPTADQVGLK